MGVYLIKSQVKSASPWPVPSCLWQIRPLQLPPVPQSCSAERSTDERGLPLCDLLPTHITQSVISWPSPEGNVGLEHIQAHAAIIPVMSHYCPATPVATRINLWLWREAAGATGKPREPSGVAVIGGYMCIKATGLSELRWTAQRFL